MKKPMTRYAGCMTNTVLGSRHGCYISYIGIMTMVEPVNAFLDADTISEGVAKSVLANYTSETAAVVSAAYKTFILRKNINKHKLKIPLHVFLL